MKTTTRALFLFAALSCGSACQEGPQTYRRTKHLFSTFRARDPARVAVDGKPDARWVELDGQVIPALTGSSGFSTWFKSDRVERGTFSGSYDLVDAEGRPQPDSPAQVIFRVKIADGSLQQQEILFEDALQQPTAETQRIEVPLPEAWRGGHIGIEAEYLGGDAGASAAWIDPRVTFSSPPVDPSLPNVLLVTADTTRRDDLGLYGGLAATPTLAELAPDGVSLDNAFTVATGTTPSHSSLFTASHSRTHGVYDNRTVLRAERVTLAEVLADIGYETAGFVSAWPVSSILGLSQGFGVFDDFFGEEQWERGADLTTTNFLKWLETRTGGPFFAWVHYFDPHQPYAPPLSYMPSAPSEEFADFFDNERGLPRGIAASEVLNEGFDLEVFAEYARSRYRGEITHMDAELGRILQRLREQGLYDETLIVFTADHGENFLEHDLQSAFGHGGLFEAVVKVPLIVKFPAGRYAGFSSEQLVGNIDIAPTILAALGSEIPDTWEGQSVLDLVGDEPRRPPLRRALVIEGAHRHELSIRSHDWMFRVEIPPEFRQKPLVDYLELGEDVRGLYDLSEDPGEEHDVYSAHRQRASGLLELLQAFEARRGRGGPLTVESEEHLEALRALGYVQ